MELKYGGPLVSALVKCGYKSKKERNTPPPNWPVKKTGVYIWVYESPVDEGAELEIHYVGRSFDIWGRNRDHAESQASAQYLIPKTFFEDNWDSDLWPMYLNNKNISYQKAVSFENGKKFEGFGVIENRWFYSDEKLISDFVRVGCLYRECIHVFYIETSESEAAGWEAYLMFKLKSRYNFREEKITSKLYENPKIEKLEEKFKNLFAEKFNAADMALDSIEVAEPAEITIEIQDKNASSNERFGIENETTKRD